MAVQDYTPLMEVLETLKCTICRPKSNLTCNREIELHLVDSRESSVYISQKAINIDTLIWLWNKEYFFL